MDRRAKIVCTLGPATYSAEAIENLVEAGMDVARMNFSHGDHADHAVVYQRVRDELADFGLVSFPTRSRELTVLSWREEDQVSNVKLVRRQAFPNPRFPTNKDGSPRDVAWFDRQFQAVLKAGAESSR